MAGNTAKKFLGMDAVMVGGLGLGLAFLGVIIVLATFAFNTIRADYARIGADQKADIEALRTERKADVDRLEASIEALRVEQKADVDRLEASIEALRVEQKADNEALRAEQRADINMLSDKIDSLEDSLDTRLDDIEREQSRLQGAVDVLRGRQAPNP